jgi:uncharacterized protein YbaR (Trm112 family)
MPNHGDYRKRKLLVKDNSKHGAIIKIGADKHSMIEETYCDDCKRWYKLSAIDDDLCPFCGMLLNYEFYNYIKRS